MVGLFGLCMRSFVFFFSPFREEESRPFGWSSGNGLDFRAFGLEKDATEVMEDGS